MATPTNNSKALPAYESGRVLHRSDNKPSMVDWLPKFKDLNQKGHEEFSSDACKGKTTK